MSLGYAGGKGSTDVLTVEQSDIKANHVTVRWTDNSNILLTVRDAQIDFQAVKCAGVLITTESPASN